ncbi:MAG: hybrid sensor histidine kinase/response regulator [Planctomycetota bacterium]|nr:MAG: hybrid sensor histidine kinase/response regulator [Planctomycetota bacterium]
MFEWCRERRGVARRRDPLPVSGEEFRMGARSPHEKPADANAVCAHDEAAQLDNDDSAAAQEAAQSVGTATSAAACSNDGGGAPELPAVFEGDGLEFADFGREELDEVTRRRMDFAGRALDALSEVDTLLQELCGAADAKGRFRKSVAGRQIASCLPALREKLSNVRLAATNVDMEHVAELAGRMEMLFDRLGRGFGRVSLDTLQMLRTCTESLLELIEREVAGSATVETFDAGQDNAAADWETRSVEACAEQLARQRDVPAELWQIFVEEAEEHLQAMYAALERLEKQPQDGEALHAVRRAAHTMKGAAGAVEIHTVSRLAHRTEDLLDRLAESRITPDGAVIQLLYRAADLMLELVDGRFDAETMPQRLFDLFQELHAATCDLGDAPGEAACAEADDRDAEERASHDAEEQVGETDEPPGDADEGIARSTVEGTAPTGEEVHDERDASGEADAGDTLATRLLRVPLDRVERLSQVVGEMVIGRAGLEQQLSRLTGFVDELRMTCERLRRIVHEMEARYGVSALGGRIDFGSIQVPDGRIVTSAPSRLDEFDELEFDRYTEFHLLTRSLAESTNDVHTIGHELRNVIGECDHLLTRHGQLLREVQQGLIRVRMVPFGTLTPRLQRTVRAAAAQANKQVALHIGGEDVELDKGVLESVAEALMHLLRNAVDHGIEPAEQRRASGKPTPAQIEVYARYEGTQVVITVRDDGVGIDPEEIRQAAVARGFLSAETAATLGQDELRQLLFVPGFSTAGRVSELSGRGMGMDIVRQCVQNLKGSIRVESEVGRGTAFRIRLPTSLAMTRALVVRAGELNVALPVRCVQQIGTLAADRVPPPNEPGQWDRDGESIELRCLADVLGTPRDADTSTDQRPVVVVGVGERCAAFVVEEVVCARDIVIKSLGSHLQSVPGLIGATIQGDGTILPILDPAALLGEDARVPRVQVPAHGTVSVQTPVVMLVDDSVSVRRVTVKLIETAGWVAIEAVDGVDALERLRTLEVRPNVFLLDIEMPRMDGYELLARLRQSPEFAQTPVVMVTSRANEKHRKKAMELGADEYLIKPYQHDRLLSLLQRLVAASAVGQC